MAAVASKTFTVEFEKEKETPGTVKFAEVETDQPPVVGSLYVKKYAVKQLRNPDRLTVTIEAG